MKVIRRYGKGAHLVWFVFYDLPPFREKFCFPPKPETPPVRVTIKAGNREEVGRILRKYHRAKQAVKLEPEAAMPPYGFRYLAKHNATAVIFTSTKNDLPYIKIYDFCYQVAGKLNSVSKYIARVKFGYRELEVK